MKLNQWIFNKYTFLAIAVVFFFIRLLRGNSDLFDGQDDLFALLKSFLQIIIIISLIPVVIAIIVGIIHPRNKKAWWDDDQKREEREPFYKVLVYSLLIAMPAMAYSLIIYFALFESYTSLLILVAGYVISFLFPHLSVRKEKTY
ncbi:MAG: hypothetical protein ABIN57_05140 [Chitinophagaceae bacterium]